MASVSIAAANTDTSNAPLDSKLIFEPNQFTLLTLPNIKIPTKKAESETKPPPIHITNLKNYTAFGKALCQKLGPDSFLCQARTAYLKVNMTTLKGYIDAIQYLRENGATFHTYQFKENKAFRVVLRHLDQNTPKELIKKKIEQKGFKVRAVSNLIHPIDKTPLPIFYIDLEQQSNNDKIFDITQLLNTDVKIEKLRKKHVIVQCQNCQQYGHTKAYCFHPTVCLKCAGNHLSSSCTRSMDTLATCALCTGQHPANYRGCPAHKKLQAIRKKLAKEEEIIESL